MDVDKYILNSEWQEKCKLCDKQPQGMVWSVASRTDDHQVPLIIVIQGLKPSVARPSNFSREPENLDSYMKLLILICWLIF